MIPDYVVQLQEIQRQFSAHTDMLKDTYWKDCVQESYYSKYIDEYDSNINKAISGKECKGKGLNDFLRFLDEKQREMYSITGIQVYIPDYAPSGIMDGLVRIDDNRVFDVHGPLSPSEEPVVSEYGERKYWDKDKYGHKPGELDDGEVSDVMQKRGIINE